MRIDLEIFKGRKLDRLIIDKFDDSICLILVFSSPIRDNQKYQIDYIDLNDLNLLTRFLDCWIKEAYEELGKSYFIFEKGKGFIVQSLETSLETITQIKEIKGDE